MLRKTLSDVDGLQLEVCADAEQVCRDVKRKDVALVLAHLDSLGGDAEATNLLWGIAATRRACPTLILAEDYLEQHACALLRAGAADFLELPADLEKLTVYINALTLRTAFSLRGVNPSRLVEETSTPGDKSLQELVTADLGDLISQIRRVAPQDTTVFLSGETGTGKTALAQLIHQITFRRTEPFLVVDCAALSGGVIESELFGHVKGAFTSADRDRQGKLVAAGVGTIFLDEVNALPLNLQAKLLRAIGEKCVEPVGAVRSVPVRARVIAASNVSLEKEVAEGRFRADLFYRLNVVAFHLPPLRERPSAIAPLAQRFLEEYAGRNRLKVQGFRPEALEAMECYDWPGNIRELRNVVERAVALWESGDIGLDALPPSLCKGLLMPRRAPKSSAPLHRSRDEAEIQQIKKALDLHRNNRMRAAAELGISRMGLYKKLHKYGFI